MRLALFGGSPVRSAPFPPHATLGAEEKREVLEVLESGLLSGFSARPDGEFYGGPKVQALESAFREIFGMRHAVAFNSATSALHACLAAVGIAPGDEVITSPYTMSASATCILMQRGTPVFADIEPDTFCLDPAAVELAITPRTKAIVAVNLFGQPAALAALSDIAQRHGLRLIEDNAQAPGATYRGRYTGTIGDFGVFSLNRHKAVQCGEGGVAVVDDEVQARRLQLVRNHGEVVADGFGWTDDARLIGYNYRMTELQAAIGVAQIRKLGRFNAHRIDLTEYLSQKLKGCRYLVPPLVRAGCTHVYYLYALKFLPETLGVPRHLLIAALQAEGIPVQGGYVKPLNRLPVFNQNFSLAHTYPVTDRLYESELLTINICRYPATRGDMDDVVRAVEKIEACWGELIRHQDRRATPVQAGTR